MNTKCIAHVKQVANEFELHFLDEHLEEVARLAAGFASKFGSSDWAELAGRWHDLGKYRSAFQSYISNVSGYDPEASIEQGKGRVDHSTAGALHSIKELKDVGRILAYVIAGHHAGLPDWDADEAAGAALSVRLENGAKKKYLEEALSSAALTGCFEKIQFSSKPLGGREGLHLWVRMLFSCLVDADFLDTEAFMSPEKTQDRCHAFNMATLKQQFDLYMQRKLEESDDTPLNKLRAGILNDCRKAADSPKGTFTLTVPTGGGKTLSSMAFALDHAVKNEMQRIIVVLPYTSIIEQTAEQYREIFGGAVLEHHSNLDPDMESSRNRLASENWDAPIIVTTNVQLLESLFAAKTSRCRKLHNIANSIIIVDEAQLLPPNFLQPSLDVFRLLVEHYGVTLVLSTATQPALGSRKDAFGKTKLKGLDGAVEIIVDVAFLYKALERVHVEKPKDMNVRTTWNELAEELIKHESALVIVNTRKDCRGLFELMPQGTLHLSALMCGEHRSQVIAEIKRKLKAGEPVRVISTQLVEAGVDLDFPVVYRALAGLDSIAQAAGRCNREGKLDKGKVVVFVPPKALPKGMLLFGEQATRSVWHKYEGDPLSHNLYQGYFEQYFNVDHDEKNILSLLVKDAGDGIVQFRSAAEKFKLIDDKGTQQIFIPYDEKAESFIGFLRSGKLERWVMRKLQRYSVMVYEHEFRKLQNIGAVEQVQLGLWAVCVTNAYDKVRGLLVADDLYSSDPKQSVM